MRCTYSQDDFNYNDWARTLWFSLNNVPAGSTILAEFLDPNGNVDMNQTFQVNSAAQQYCNASISGVFYDYPGGFVPATLPGIYTYFSTANSHTGDMNKLYYSRWNSVNQVWVPIGETDFDPLSSGRT